MSPGYKMLKDLGVKLSAEAITREALIRELRECTNTQADPVTGVLYLHSSLTIYSQELTVFLGHNNTQLMMDLTDWFDCRDYWTYRTKHQGTDEIIGVFVNLIGATTPELLQTTLPQNAIGGGLTSRMIFVYEFDKGKTVPAPFLSEEEQKLGDQLVRDLEQIFMLQGEFKITEDFKDTYCDWYSNADIEQHNMLDPRFASYYERKATHTMKLSMILSASQSSDMILEKHHFTQALDIIKRTEKNMQYTFLGVGKSPMSDTMSKVVQMLAQRGTMHLSELVRSFWADANAQQMDGILQTLETMQVARRVFAGNERLVEYTGKSVHFLDSLFSQGGKHGDSK